MGQGQSARARRTQAERSQATRSALLAAARELFTAHGFAGAGRDRIAERAGVTRGALYHHFPTKEHLFLAVIEELEGEIAERVAAAALDGKTPSEQFRLGCLAFLDACLDPAVGRLVLLEARAVLGTETWREIDERHGLALVAHGLEAVMAAGELAPAPVMPLAHLLLGALNEAALLVAGAEQPEVARAEVGASVELLLDRLLASR